MKPEIKKSFRVAIRDKYNTVVLTNHPDSESIKKLIGDNKYTITSIHTNSATHKLIAEYQSLFLAVNGHESTATDLSNLTRYELQKAVNKLKKLYTKLP